MKFIVFKYELAGEEIEVLGEVETVEGSLAEELEGCDVAVTSRETVVAEAVEADAEGVEEVELGPVEARSKGRNRQGSRRAREHIRGGK